VAGTVIITGGTGGLGVAVTSAFLEAGWRAVVPWVVEAEVERMEARPHLHLMRADLFDLESVRKVVARATEDAEAPLAAVVNLVGGYSEPGKVHEASIDDFEAQLRLNLRPTYLVCHAAIPELLANGGGAITCVGSRAAERPFAGVSGYVAAKAGVVAFVRALDAEYRQEGIRANAVLPSIIDTEANRRAQPDADYSKWVRPEEIARVILFLCSAEASAISGAAVPVYGRA
jgi:NAD(P)-dependent dehydrogenase (short-subunit alcohol dehydrogenase family)